MTFARDRAVLRRECTGMDQYGQDIFEVPDGTDTNAPARTSVGGVSPQASHAARGMPMSATHRSPASAREAQSPALTPTRVHVAAACTQGAKSSPVVASSPLGTSMARTGDDEALSASIAAACGGRGAASRPVPGVPSSMKSTPALEARTGPVW